MKLIKKNVASDKDWKSLTDLYKKKTGNKIADSVENFEMYLYLNEPSHCEVLSYFSKFKIPDSKRIEIYRVKNGNEEVSFDLF